jgi:PilZ domain
MGTTIREHRTHPRTCVNWRVEYTGTSGADEIIHESSKLENYSPVGACFLTMSEVRVGMRLTLQISLPARLAQPLTLKGEVVRVDDKADVGRMFKAAAVRWLPMAPKI